MGITILLVCAFSVVAVSASQSTIKWKLQAASPAGGILVEKYAKVFASLVEERSKGRLIIKVYPSSAIVSPMEITAAVGKGVIEMGEGGPNLDIGSIPLANVAGNLPFSWETPEDQYEFWHVYKGGKAMEMINDAYHEKGVHNILFATQMDEYVALTNFPVNKLEDWKGKKIRTVGVYGKAMSILGASTVNISLPEIYMGIQTGTIDGAIVGLSLLDEFKLKEVVKYIIRPAFASSAIGSLYVNLDKWNGLSDDLKEIVNKAAHDTYAETLLPYSVELRNKIFEETVPEEGIEVIDLSEKETQRLRQALAPVWDYVGGMSQENADLLNLLKEHLDSKGTLYPGKEENSQ